MDDKKDNYLYAADHYGEHYLVEGSFCQHSKSRKELAILLSDNDSPPQAIMMMLSEKDTKQLYNMLGNIIGEK